MVNKDDCANTIREFIHNPQQNTLVTLFIQLCDIKEPIDKDKKIAYVVNDPVLLSRLSYYIIEELILSLDLVKVTNNNNLISVF
jgi:hypothetical protein